MILRMAFCMFLGKAHVCGNSGGGLGQAGLGLGMFGAAWMGLAWPGWPGLATLPGMAWLGRPQEEIHTFVFCDQINIVTLDRDFV